MKAILDWKYDTNGDPMVDVEYFLMMFMQPVDYGYPALARLDLLMGKDNTNDRYPQPTAVYYYRTHVHTNTVKLLETTSLSNYS